jgi:hypothetical protein
MTRDRASVVATAALHIVVRYVPEIFADSSAPLHAELSAYLRDEFCDVALATMREIRREDE